MKYFSIIVGLMLITYTRVLSQKQEIGVGIHVSRFNADAQQSKNIGIGMSFFLYQWYVDGSSNFAFGEGEELYYSSAQTYKSKKVNLGVVNIGYIFKIKRFNLIPHIGLGIKRDIYQDPVAWDTFYFGVIKKKFNIGLLTGISLTKTLYFNLGFGTYEKFKGGLALIM